MISRPRPESPLPASLSAQAVNAPVFVPKAPFHVIASPSPTSASPFIPSYDFYVLTEDY
jgi:PAB-dependent poly(A)-specific ribonuclease subunit 3